MNTLKSITEYVKSIKEYCSDFEINECLSSEQYNFLICRYNYWRVDTIIRNELRPDYLLRDEYSGPRGSKEYESADFELQKHLENLFEEYSLEEANEYLDLSKIELIKWSQVQIKKMNVYRTPQIDLLFDYFDSKYFDNIYNYIKIQFRGSEEKLKELEKLLEEYIRLVSENEITFELILELTKNYTIWYAYHTS